jgi:hypothetical protein
VPQIFYTPKKRLGGAPSIVFDQGAPLDLSIGNFNKFRLVFLCILDIDFRPKSDIIRLSNEREVLNMNKTQVIICCPTYEGMTKKDLKGIDDLLRFKKRYKKYLKEKSKK